MNKCFGEVIRQADNHVLFKWEESDDSIFPFAEQEVAEYDWQALATPYDDDDDDDYDDDDDESLVVYDDDDDD